MDIDSYLHYREYRGAVYKLLSQNYYLPNEQTISNVSQLVEALAHIGPEFAQFADGVSEHWDIEELKVDFSRLFVGPFQLLAVPYGSVYLESGRQVMGDSTSDAARRYREAGLDFSDAVKEAPDHIAFELEFMYYLIFKEIEAAANSNMESSAAFLTKQVKFLNTHLGVWISEFTNLVEEKATTDFYRNLAAITRLFVLGDMAQISKRANSEIAATLSAG